MAAPPPEVNFQGRLLDTAGDPLSGSADLHVGVYGEAAGGTPLYSEDHTDVPLAGGVFSILLGSGTSPAGTFDGLLFAEMDRWIEVSVNGEVLDPRQAFSSVAYPNPWGTAQAGHQ